MICYTMCRKRFSIGDGFCLYVWLVLVCLHKCFHTRCIGIVSGLYSTPFPRLWEKNWWEPILREDNLWFASFEGGKSEGEEKNVGGRRKVWGGRSILREELLEGGAF